ncbi:hypothetical protein [Thiomicrorhabdus sp. Kp2]|uniref:hypothetical protein n=1 Tax=Thiomicrorhabdus sp. Kp2 TaxID=1123518 RepID=UPI00041726AC|nr:hypothetical protein [Thiomicrorhabdus sp. Kp2]
METTPELEKLAFEFFKIFARAEYSLKASGFNRGDGNAEADWSAFSKQVKSLIQNPNNQQLQAAIDFVISQPPKKQVIVNGKIEWSDSNPTFPDKAENLLVYIRRVRNNLFHGGKFNGHWFEPERSEQLISKSLIILKACINHNKDTKKAYES